MVPSKFTSADFGDRKHGKTHSRPFKCFEKTCKYAVYGWPTQKERDRHQNDKHSDAPQWYKCDYDCTYRSKRESNCKQHMEKTHGYKYERQKGNGGKKATRVAGPDVSTGAPTPQTPHTPQMDTPTSTGAGFPTPITGDNSPFMERFWPMESAFAPYPDTPADGLHDPMDLGDSSLGGQLPDLTPAFAAGQNFSSYGVPDLGVSETNIHIPFGTAAAPHPAADYNLHGSYGPYQEICWESLAGLEEEPNAQLMTPNLSNEQHLYQPRMESAEAMLNDTRRLSPGGQPDITFTSDMLGAEEDYDGALPAPGRQTQDFMLFSSNENSSRGSLIDADFLRAVPPTEHMEAQDQYAQLLDLDEEDLYN